MSTIINTPSNGESSDNFLSALLGIIVVIILVILFFVYALPAIKNSNVPAEKQDTTLDINVKLPEAPKEEAPQQ